jgi:para-aminobenzoate synthetase/4-amino-4-deoxychorismate lyase
MAAVGFLTYEAAPAFDSALATHPPGPLPLAWFAVYQSAGEEVDLQPGVEEGSPEHTPLAWHPSLSREAYTGAIARIKDYIAAGHTYQVNYTLRLRSRLSGDPRPLFRRLLHTNQARYGAYIDTGRADHVLAST